MMIDDVQVTRKIFERYSREFLNMTQVDVVIAGAGPAGLTTARILAKAGKKVLIIERKLAPGGGMWGGGMNYPVIVIQPESRHLLDEIGVRVEDAADGYFTADSIECVAKLLASAIDAGAKVWNAVTVEDVMIRKDRISGVVINWTGVNLTKMHVDPLTIGASFVVDGTGHDASVCTVARKKAGKLNTPSGDVMGERSMWAEVGEQTVVENTGEVYPGLVVIGMAANAVMGAPRMGPIFGGMLLSGEKAAGLILSNLDKT
ncbi:MAG: sulfide-dependent adenosine diphosphate thiazole synthase [Candidatus Thermoplasmatota archaeon]|nr:thiazole biosynthesis protein [Euryarchaeota archaeon]MBU4031710.1 sulfide-dependent adenosine diphosphate thiazole synthase [Candidatus Thermoplasmatota archaeon]MBU4070941.1 sulfide-dependent adenosine diphosphate thiazole synthase [Candidatus Thermoplasmatota archaeon]MBU4144000.1 sulfide-dependent adenosine diphosphate thiazole synthase [Candidatus Thermoplasmatota archaeon]MBU4591886.1 sulfide-dependent adenosine diphosphate thiazole synthase [Candidatus Thermoplasmatota archaeon]